MKRFAFAAVLFIAFTSTLVQGQTIDLRATIPFEFRVGQTEMPAGEYVIHHLPQGALILREDGGRHTALVALTVGEYRPAALQTGELQFNRYGQTYFLAKLWAPASRDGVALRMSPRETELARQLGLAQHTSIALVRK
jgi:hypothetical protein